MGIAETIRWISSIPFAVENLFFNGGKIVIQSMISILGTATIAANGVLNTLMPIAEIIPASLAMAIVPIVGKMVGAKEYQDIGKVLRLFLGVCAVFLLVFNVAMYPVYQHVSDIFHVSQEAAGLIQGVYVYLIVAHPAIWALSFVTPAALRAMNEGKFTTIVALCSMWTIRVLMAYIVLQFGGNLVGVYVVMMLEWGVRGVIFVTKFIRKNRQQLQLATQVEIED